MSMLQLYEECELQDALRRAGRRLVVVAFTSGKCGPCRLTTPFLESLCPKMPDIIFIKIDVSDSEDFVERFQITGIPAFYFFRNGNVVYHFQGANTTFLGNKIEELRFQI
ncbi:thioredoxin-like [Spea bombifrons]|uniref:thioredoxin-like n=1 Tax=Spea bombifrons TaxID=233779 RepID=UPI00234BBE1F|nr:thioredoxin-like [Spea bombifrons]